MINGKWSKLTDEEPIYKWIYDQLNQKYRTYHAIEATKHYP